MNRIAPRPLASFARRLAMAALLASPGCNDAPEVATAGAGAAPARDPFAGDLAPLAAPSATSSLSPFAEDFLGGELPGAEPKLDPLLPASPLTQAATPETDSNPFIGVNFSDSIKLPFLGEAMPGTVDEALAAMQKADERKTVNEFDRTWVQARYLINQNRLGEAEPLCEKLRKLDPHDVRGQVTEGMLYLARKDYRRAAAVLEIASRADPKNVEIYRYLLFAHMELKNPTAALADLAAWLEQEPDSAEVRLGRLNILCTQKRFAEILPDCEALIRLRPANFEGYYFRAVYHLKKRRQADAQRDFEESVRRGMPKATEKQLRPEFFPAT
jgi:tetratricopeptide (TPR) repeat protein